MEFNKNVQALIALNGLEIGLSRKHNAVSLFEQPADMFTEAEAALFELKKAVGEENALTLLKNLKSDYVSDRTKEMEKEGVFAVSYLDDEYPEIFESVYPKPLLLYVKGNVSLLKSETVAVAGPRKPTRYAETVTYDFCTEFAKAGLTVVSGLAAGIDGTAHRAALDAGGKTVAVVANGLDVVYPAEHRGLRESILLNDGLIISEYKLKKTECLSVPRTKQTYMRPGKSVVRSRSRVEKRNDDNFEPCRRAGERGFYHAVQHQQSRSLRQQQMPSTGRENGAFGLGRSGLLRFVLRRKIKSGADKFVGTSDSGRAETGRNAFRGNSRKKRI